MAGFADEKDVANYEVLRAVVCYRLDGGALGWVGQQLKKLESRLDLDTSVSLDATLSSKESNTQKIIQGLGGEEISAFTLEDFNESVETHPNLKISASKYTRKECLPRVLDALGFTYHPNPTKDLFVPTKAVEIPTVRDPRSKPKLMMSEADTRLAVKVDALEKLASLSDSRERYQYEKGEAVEIIRQIASNALEDDAAESANDPESQDGRGKKIPSRNFTSPSGESTVDREEWIDQALEELADVDVEEVPKPALETVIETWSGRWRARRCRQH